MARVRRNPCAIVSFFSEASRWLKSTGETTKARVAVLPFDAFALHHHRRLVGRMAAGDADALREFYELHATGVHRVVARILCDREEVREAVQDTFIKAWRLAATYRPDRGEAVAWLVFIARNTAIDRLRGGARRRALLAAAANDPDRTGPPDSAPADDREFLEHHLAGLSPAQRQALELAFFGGYSQEEIAQQMRTPVGNVKNHLRRGLLKLRQLAGHHD